MRITDQEDFFLLQSLTNTFKKHNFGNLVLLCSSYLCKWCHLPTKATNTAEVFPASSVKENMPHSVFGKKPLQVKEKEPRTQVHLGPEVYFNKW